SALAQTQRRHLLCRQYLRLAGFARQIRELVRQETLGRIRSVKIDYVTQQLAALSDPKGWRGTWSRAGGGVIMDLAIHPIDFLCNVFGPAQVQTALCRRLRATASDKAEDFAVILLEYGNGLVAQISLM